MFLLQMAGHPGSGKSTVSRKIARAMNAIVIDRDVIKTSMINSQVPNDIVSDASCMAVFDLTEFYLDMGSSVIIDTPCYYEEIVNNGTRISKKYGAKYKYIECRVEDYYIIKGRINTRDRLISQIDDTLSIERVNKALDKSIKPRDGKYITIDTRSEDSYNLDFIVDYLKK